MEVDTSMMIILVMSWNTSMTVRYDYLDSVINLSWMYMHDRKCDLL